MGCNLTSKSRNAGVEHVLMSRDIVFVQRGSLREPILNLAQISEELSLWVANEVACNAKVFFLLAIDYQVRARHNFAFHL